jgi:hypothetical protein
MEKLSSTEMDFWRRVAQTPNILKERMNLKKKNGNNTTLERMENNMLKWYGYALHMGDNRWPKQQLTWLPQGGGEDAQCSGKGKMKE